DRVRGNTKQITMNPNVWAMPAATVAVGSNGQPSVNVDTNGFTNAELLAMHAGQQRIQARGKWASERAPNRWEVLERNGLLPQPAQKALPPPPEPAQAVGPRLDLRGALNQSTLDNLILGQDDNGELCHVSL